MGGRHGASRQLPHIAGRLAPDANLLGWLTEIRLVPIDGRFSALVFSRRSSKRRSASAATPPILGVAHRSGIFPAEEAPRKGLNSRKIAENAPCAALGNRRLLAGPSQPHTSDP